MEPILIQKTKKPSEDGLVDNTMRLNFVARYSDF